MNANIHAPFPTLVVGDGFLFPNRQNNAMDNTIHVRFVGEESVNQIVEFPHEEEYREHSFDLQPVKGVQKVVFVFLPGCDFDFKWFRFE